MVSTRPRCSRLERYERPGAPIEAISEDTFLRMLPA